MSISIRYINLSLVTLVMCLASGLILTTTRTAKANFIGECPDDWNNCGSCSEFRFEPFGDRCATAESTYSTSGGVITQKECCVYGGYNAYCDDIFPDALMGQRYVLQPLDGMGSAVCEGEDTDRCLPLTSA